MSELTPGSNKDIIEILYKIFKVLDSKIKDLEIQIKKIEEIKNTFELNEETFK